MKMKCKNARRGFTLIELLVVVLIIGILAAVAVPQYQKAVEKARAVEAISALTSIMKGVELYMLANGSGVPTFDQLDISVGDKFNDSTVWTQYYSITLTEDTSTSGRILATATRGKREGTLGCSGGTCSAASFTPTSPLVSIQFARETNGTIHRYCLADESETTLCKAIKQGGDWN